MTDNEVIVGMKKAALDSSDPAHVHANRIIERKHFRLFYEANPADQDVNLNASEQVYSAACQEFRPENVRRDSYTQKGGSQSFPVRLKDGRIAQSVELSDTLAKVPVVAVDRVFIDKTILPDAQKWLGTKRKEIITPQKEVD